MEELITEIKALIREVYETNSVGGCAHIVLDDYNVSNHHLDWAEGFAQGFRYARESDRDMGDIEPQIKCIQKLRQLPYKLRKKIVEDR